MRNDVARLAARAAAVQASKSNNLVCGNQIWKLCRARGERRPRLVRGAGGLLWISCGNRGDPAVENPVGEVWMKCGRENVV